VQRSAARHPLLMKVETLKVSPLLRPEPLPQAI
jgi:hypothetical protein